MSDKKILVVFGATGIQGGSVINSVLGDPKTAATYKIRGVTRDTTKASAQALASRGVEVVAVCNLTTSPVTQHLEHQCSVPIMQLLTSGAIGQHG